MSSFSPRKAVHTKKYYILFIVWHTLRAFLHRIRRDEQNQRSDKSALFIEIIFQPKRNDPCVVPRNPSTKRARQPHSAASPYLPKRQKLPPRAPAPYKAKQIFAMYRRVLLGGKFSVSEGGLEGESPVFQEGALSLQGLLPPSKVFLSPRKFSHNAHVTCA